MKKQGPPPCGMNKEGWRIIDRLLDRVALDRQTAIRRRLGYTLSRVVGPSSWAFGENGDVSVPVSGPLRASNGDALVEAARLGLGIIYQPEFVVLESIARGDLVAETWVRVASVNPSDVRF